MRYHIDITPTGYSAAFYVGDSETPCATDTGTPAELTGVCQRVQADPNIESATYTGNLPAGSYPKFSA